MSTGAEGGGMTKPDKPIGSKAYGSIPHIPGSRLGPGDYTIHQGQASICTTDARGRTVWVQTKLDGSCVSVARIDGGDLVALGRAGYAAITSPHQMHHVFDAWSTHHADRFAFLKPGERVVGEWLAQAHGTKYDLRDRPPFVAFDIMRGTTRATMGEFIDRAAGLLAIPDTISGPIEPGAAMDTLDDYGADEPEGVVYRVEHNGAVEFLAKWVHADKVDGKYLFGDPVWNWVDTDGGAT